ncbi:MAG: sulfurtransferase [Alphaproteobacteria bacterium]|nr:sulfurtransferase [Alphaproteobacteria bacterium]
MAASVSNTSVPSISVEALRRLQEQGRVSFYDVRRRARYEASGESIPNAPWRDPEQADSWSRFLLTDRPVVVACVHGREVSQNAAAALRSRGLDAYYLEGGMEAWRGAGHPMEKQIPPSKGSVWITRERPKIDRIACPWLVRRFHDSGATFLYVPSEWVIPESESSGAIPYDIPGVEFSHDGELCSFDVMLRRLGLGENQALADVALVVRGADTGRLDLAPEAAGLLAISVGLSALFPDDQEMLGHGMTVYDALYMRFTNARGETHGWPPKG